MVPAGVLATIVNVPRGARLETSGTRALGTIQTVVMTFLTPRRFVEQARMRAVLAQSRDQAADLMHVSGAEEFVRVVGDASKGWFGLRLLQPSEPRVQQFDFGIMCQATASSRVCRLLH